MNEEYIYHYTSAETLGLIIHNNALKLGHPHNFNDAVENTRIDESRVAWEHYAFCATLHDKEQIPLWLIYTGIKGDLRKGVRIRIKANENILSGIPPRRVSAI